VRSTLSLTALTQISSAEDHSKTVLVLALSISRPMSPAVCNFWNRNNSKGIVTLDSFFILTSMQHLFLTAVWQFILTRKAGPGMKRILRPLPILWLMSCLRECSLISGVFLCIILAYFSYFFGRADEVDAVSRAAHEWPETMWVTQWHPLQKALNHLSQILPAHNSGCLLGQTSPTEPQFLQSTCQRLAE
jgi:hypothetical protein